MSHSKDLVKTQVTLRGGIAEAVNAMVEADKRPPAEVVREIVTRWVRANGSDLAKQYGFPDRWSRTVIPYEQKR